MQILNRIAKWNGRKVKLVVDSIDWPVINRSRDKGNKDDDEDYSNDNPK